MNNFFNFISFLPFLIEIVIFSLIVFLINIYLFRINSTINNDQFLVDFLIIFLFILNILFIYLFFVDIELFFFIDKLMVVDINNLFVKLFLLIHLIYYVFYDH